MGESGGSGVLAATPERQGGVSQTSDPRVLSFTRADTAFTRLLDASEAQGERVRIRGGDSLAHTNPVSFERHQAAGRLTIDIPDVCQVTNSYINTFFPPTGDDVVQKSLFSMQVGNSARNPFGLVP